jgi:hypothetical protein
MGKQRVPGSREEESWFSEEQLEQLEPADQGGDELRSPVPTQMVSNGEYLPNPQTAEQKQVERRILELSDRAARRLGVSRRQFLAGTGGFAVSFLAMNEAHGAEFFKVSKEEIFEAEAHGRHGPPRNLFVFDDQLHTIRSSRTGPGNALRDIAQGNHNIFNPTDLPDELGGINTPWNPKLVGVPNLNSNFHLVQFMKDVYLDSQVTIGVLSNNTSSAVPDQGTPRPPKNIKESEAGEFLSAPQTASVRDWVNEIAGSTRMLAHGQLFPGVGNQNDPVFGDYHRWQIENLRPDSWKGYTSANSAKLDSNPDSLMTRWVLDDEQVAYPMYQVITAPEYRHYLKTHPGFYNICIHKGLSTTAPDDPSSEPLGFPTDIPKAAKDWPMLNFLIYHSCIRPGFWVRNALLDVQSGNLRQGVPDILWTTRFLVDSAPYPNVYAELGTTFASSVITFPSVCAHILGQALRFFGEDRVLFGSDAVWYGSPQWQIEALWRFRIPEWMQEKYGYPALTERAKRKILGLNNARLYGIKNVNGRLTTQEGDCEDENDRRYHPVPWNFESLIPIALKKMMEFPQFALNDMLSKLRERYLAAGPSPSHTRHGWLRKG